MPRKVKQNVIEQATEQIQPEEIKVEFDDFSTIKNKVEEENNNDNDIDNNIDNNIIDNVDENINEQPVKVRKPRIKKINESEDGSTTIKRTRTKKNIVIEDLKQPEITPEVEQPTTPVEEVKPEKKIRTQELVECSLCNKQMTKKTLRYFHEKICPGAPIDRENQPVKKRTNKKENVEVEMVKIPQEVIENEVKKRIQNAYKERVAEKMKQKEERIKKLATQIA